MVLAFKDVGETSTAKNQHPVSLFSVVSKVLEKLKNSQLVDQLEKWDLSPDFQYGLGRLNQQQIFSQLHLIKLLGFLTGLGLLNL